MSILSSPPRLYYDLLPATVPRLKISYRFSPRVPVDPEPSRDSLWFRHTRFGTSGSRCTALRKVNNPRVDNTFRNFDPSRTYDPREIICDLFGPKSISSPSSSDVKSSQLDYTSLDHPSRSLFADSPYLGSLLVSLFFL